MSHSNLVKVLSSLKGSQPDTNNLKDNSNSEDTDSLLHNSLMLHSIDVVAVDHSHITILDTINNRGYN